MIIIAGMPKNAFVEIMNGVVDLKSSRYESSSDSSSFPTRFLSNLSDFPMKFSNRFKRHSKWVSRSVSKGKETPEWVSLSTSFADQQTILPDSIVDIAATQKQWLAWSELEEYDYQQEPGVNKLIVSHQSSSTGDPSLRVLHAALII